MVENRNCYKIYKHTTPNDKVYIGLTRQKPKIRWNNGKSYNKYFTNAINKYGWNNIKHEILEDNLTYEEACDKERYYISKFDSTNSKKGFNIMIGGTPLDSEVRKLMSINNKNKKKLICIIKKYNKICDFDGYEICIFNSITDCAIILKSSKEKIRTIMKQSRPSFSINQCKRLSTNEFDAIKYVYINNIKNITIYEYEEELFNYIIYQWEDNNKILFLKYYNDVISMS